VKDMQSLFEALNAADNRAMIIWQRGSERMAAWFDWEKDAVEATQAPN